jgi:CRP-like cAMP-binding protein
MADSFFVEHSKIRFGPGDVICHKGEMAEQMLFVVSGAVRLYLADDASGMCFEELGRGDFFGEGSLLEALPMEATAVAATKTELISISRGSLLRMLRQNPEVAVKMMQGLAKRNRLLAAKIGQGSDAAARGASPKKREKACLVSITSGQKYMIESDRALIGRLDIGTNTTPDIDLTNDDGHLSVSRRHANIIHEHGRYFIQEENGVVNGTFTRGSRLSPGEVRELFDGDRIGFGTVMLSFHVLIV